MAATLPLLDVQKDWMDHGFIEWLQVDILAVDVAVD